MLPRGPCRVNWYRAPHSPLHAPYRSGFRDTGALHLVLGKPFCLRLRGSQELMARSSDVDVTHFTVDHRVDVLCVLALVET